MFQYEASGHLTSGSRKWGGSVLSIGVHVVCGAAALAISQMVPATPPKAMKSALTYMAAVTMPVVPDEPAVIDLPAMELPTLEPVAVALTPKPEVAPQPLPEIARAEVLTPMPAVAPQVVQPKVAEPPPAKEVTLGAFAAAEVPIKASESRQQTAAAGFDAAPQQVAQNARQTAAVIEAGFGATAGAKAPAPQNQAVADSGFGAAGVGSNQTRPAPQQIKQTGFDEPAAATTTPKRAVTPQRVDVPLEVLSKPIPAYTAEARQMRVEGEVSLDVEFCASGHIRVLRVVRGLGHGLDEEAIRAAEKIRFKPAQSHGRSVDFKTTVHISFRLS
jgi:TonB family protein